MFIFFLLLSILYTKALAFAYAHIFFNTCSTYIKLYDSFLIIRVSYCERHTYLYMRVIWAHYTLLTLKTSFGCNAKDGVAICVIGTFYISFGSNSFGMFMCVFSLSFVRLFTKICRLPRPLTIESIWFEINKNNLSKAFLQSQNKIWNWICIKWMDAST